MTNFNGNDFKGATFLQGDAGYEEARVGRVFNARKPKRFPEMVLFPEDEADVIAAVKLANERGWKIAIRAGGHSWAAWSVRDQGMLLDLSRLQEIELDPITNIVRVSPAIKGGEQLAPFLESHGLMFAGGHCPTVGIGGFLLQGGMGWNCRGWGWACESIVAIDVVTASGELVRADATQNTDLYWAARGAGPGFFGVVTRFHLQARAHPKALTQSTQVYPIGLCDDVLRWAQETHGKIDSSVELVVLSLTPPGASEPVMVVHAVAMVDTPEEGRNALAPLETCPVLSQAFVHDVALPTSFADERRDQIQQNPEGCRYAADSAWLEGSPEKVVPLLHDAFTTLPNTKTFTLWFSMAPLRPLPDMALSLQTEIYFAIYTVWDDEADDERCRAWLANCMKKLEPVNAGQYLGDSDFTVRTGKFVGAENWQKLEALRAKHDPRGMFHSYLTSDETTLNTNPWQLEASHD
jgi:hypothetical protein